MHRDFVKEHPENVFSYAYYYKMVKSLNISFVKLGEEECELCELHSNHLKEEHPTENITMEDDEPVCKKKKGNEKRVVDGCVVCSTLSKHTETSNRSREEYKHDKERKVQDNEVVVSTDMQKAFMHPRMTGLKTAVFCQRLVVFHQTFAPLGGKGKSVGVIWHEGIRGRDAKDVASTFIKFMHDVAHRDKDHFIIWADNCTAQNKNWWLYTTLVSEVNRLAGPLSIT